MNQSVINNLAAKINSKEQKSNKVTNWNNTPSDDKYPSEKLVKDSLDGKANSTHNQASSTITDSHTYTNIGNVANTQESINSAIDTKLGQLSNIDAINVVSTLPTASSSTMGKLYIISEYGAINVYYTEEDNGSYSWHEMDADILDELSIDWIDIINNPFSSALPEDYATSSHSHGNITSDGKIGSASGYLLITSTGGVITSVQSLTSSKIKDPNEHNNIGTIGNATQTVINTSIDTALGNKANTSDLGAVALSNSYNDLTNKPNIPSASSTTPSADTTNGSVGNGTTWARSNHTHPKSSIYAESNHNHNIWELNQTDNNGMTAFEFVQGSGGYDGQNDAYYVLGGLYYDIVEDSMYYDNGQGQGPYGHGEEIATIADIPNINGKENVSNKVTSLSSSSTDTQYPSAKLVKDSLDLKADKTTTLDTTNLSAYVENKFLILTDEEEEEMITIGCAIIWNDQNNSNRIRPLSVKCTLSDGSEYILSNINDWSITIQVPKYDTSNEEIQYVWSVADIAGYRLTTTVNNNITTFTLRKLPT